MSSPFQFKQFTVHQEQAAMKIGFDAILLGAWAGVGKVRRIVDVGTGTGVIALMLAQRTQNDRQLPRIDAVEIDEPACSEARMNVQLSRWNDRINVVHASAQEYLVGGTNVFDLMVCNPPFFEVSSRYENARAMARQECCLTFAELCDIAKQCLTIAGRLAVIQPFDRLDELLAVSTEAQLHCHRRMDVSPVVEKDPHRVLLEFTRDAVPTNYQRLAIERQRHDYTPEFRQLAKDFYLRF